jgi:hypothetical protein
MVLKCYATNTKNATQKLEVNDQEQDPGPDG